MSQPKFWWLLSEADRLGYNFIHAYIKNNPESNQRNKRLSSFVEMLEVIRSYAIRGDCGDSNRCLVCGVLWLPGAIALNTHQLGFLLSKCKSSINGSLQILGYKELITRKTASDLVANSLSSIRDDRSELRKWTVRCIDESILNLPITEEKTVAEENHNNYSLKLNKLKEQKKLKEINNEKVQNEEIALNNGNDTIKREEQINFANIDNFDNIIGGNDTDNEFKTKLLEADNNNDDDNFEKEDFILSQALGNYNESYETQNDFWNAGSITDNVFIFDL